MYVEPLYREINVIVDIVLKTALYCVVQCDSQP